jgi:branched-chain amino acid transport system permease protein
MSLRHRSSYVLGAAALLAWPLVFSSPYELRVFTLAGIYAILVLGYQFIFGHVGALSLTQGAFFGLSAYVTGVLSTRYGLPFALTFALSIAAPVLLAVLVAAPVLRLGSHYFALATLGIAQIAFLIAIKWESVSGGANGISSIPGIVVLGAEIPRGLSIAGFVWACVALAAFLAWQITRGLYGRAYHLMRTNETAASSIGLDTARLRLGAFMLSAGFAGIAGALHAHTLRVVSPEVLEFHVMVACLAMTVIGSRTRIAGAILGAFLLVHLPEWFRFLEGAYLIAYGLILLAMIVMAPDGLIGLWDSARERWSGRSSPGLPPIARSPLPGRAPISTGAPLLSVDGITKRFGGIDALSDVSLQVRAGEILGLIGPNGSGKTTLINVISGLYAADAGRVRLYGTDIIGHRPFIIARLGIARTFQTVALVEAMTALDNVAVACLSHGGGFRRALLSPMVDLALARGQAYALLDQLGLADLAATKCAQLPQGAKRRVEIARALATRPLLLMLDEPAAGLSGLEQADLAERLSSMARAGLAVVVVEHNMPFLMRAAGRIACLDAGRLIAEGPPATIQADPDVIAAYLGTEPIRSLAR